MANIVRKDKSNAHRRYSLNEFFFDTIDTEEKAYFLGFIFADGFIFKKENNFMIGLEIKEDDIALLQKYRQALSSSSPIKTHHYKDRDSVKLRVYSRHMVEQLIQKGCTERKSLNLKFPNNDIIPKELLHHFMRGYFDGDGSIKRSSNPRNQRCVQVEIVSSNYFLPVFMEKLKEYAGVNAVKIKTHNSGNFSSFTYGGKGNATKIYSFLYRDATIFLKRKYDRFIDYLSIPHT